MRITTKGQVTIPLAIREAAGFLPHTEVEFVMEEDGIRIIKAEQAGAKPDRGQMLVAHLRGRGSRLMTTDEIMALTRGE
ncbi:MAG: AbrB/MazE/SpoVT family DNA-binding domain-containing protein [Chloroflexi bacterium]|nr:AbrB/MazE/SpoVT family DNA-binding domain-containing protein [Chloroflexota bacterium]